MSCFLKKGGFGVVFVRRCRLQSGGIVNERGESISGCDRPKKYAAKKHNTGIRQQLTIFESTLSNHHRYR